MELQLSPQRSSDSITYEVSGDDLIIDGNPVDLSGNWAVLEGELPENLISGEQDENGNITITVRATYGPDSPDEAQFPNPVELSDGDAITFPDYWEKFKGEAEEN